MRPIPPATRERIARKAQMKKYDVIYADPPWRYDFSRSVSRGIENQYETMEIADICALNIPSKKNAVLYLWATAPKLCEALKVMDAWGFNYKTHAVWDKEIIGMGYWFRGQHELLLVGVKGKYSPPSPVFRIPSVFRQKRNKHSNKPLSVKYHIAKWTKNVEKLELFAREKTEGWDAWGNEIDSDLIISKRE